MSQLSSSTRYCSRCLSTFEDDHEQCPNLSCRRGRPAVGWGRMYGPGDVFDRHYRIHNLLALGGAGVTYLAREVGVDGEEVGPRLALKVLFATRDEGPYLRRLATEAQIIQELDHPNIVQYLGFVHRAGHSPYLVTRFEAGGSLLDHIKRVGSMSVRRSSQVCRQICWSLDKAHGMGVVHRDLKPENVLLARVVGPDEDPVVRVADFGIAKVQGSLASVTRVGAFVGTPQYAAPEQFIGGTPAPTTDVYGVGALLYFCTMVMPVVRFADRLDPADSYQLLVDSLPPVVVRSHDQAEDVRRLNRILEVCMDPDPNQRCTVEQLDGLLGALLADREPDIDAVRPPKHSSSRTLSADPDSYERLSALPADPTTPLERAPRGQVATQARTREVEPPPDALVPPQAEAPTEKAGDGGALGVLAGVAAGAAVGAAAGWLASRDEDSDEVTAQEPPAAEPLAADPLAAEPLAAEPLAAEPLAAEPLAPALPEPEARPAASPAKRRSVLPLVFLALVFGSGAVVAGWVWLAWKSPSALPSPLRLAPVTLQASKPADLEVVNAIQQALQDRLPDLRSRCGASSGSLTATLVVEPAGQVRSIKLADVSAGLDPRCAGEVLTSAPLPSPGWRPVRVGLALEL